MLKKFLFVFFNYRCRSKKDRKLSKKFPKVKFSSNVLIDEGSSFGSDVKVLDNAQIVGSNIASGSIIGINSRVKNCSIEENVVIHNSVNAVASQVGRRTYITQDSKIYNCSIGRYCSIGSELRTGLSKHPANDFVSTYPAFFSKDNSGCLCSFVDHTHFDDDSELTTIGNDVWIGLRVVIVSGVRIGNGAIIGAGAVVTKDVPDYAIVAGVPAKLIRYRFQPEDIEYLLNLSWWNKDEDWIKRHAEDFKDIRSLRKIEAYK